MLPTNGNPCEKTNHVALDLQGVKVILPFSKRRPTHFPHTVTGFILVWLGTRPRLCLSVMVPEGAGDTEATTVALLASVCVN